MVGVGKYNMFQPHRKHAAHIQISCLLDHFFLFHETSHGQQIFFASVLIIIIIICFIACKENPFFKFH